MLLAIAHTSRGPWRFRLVDLDPICAHVSKVNALNEKGESVNFLAKGWFARMVQHEYDHLQGSLFIDKMLSKTFGSDTERAKHPPSQEDIRYDGV